MSAPQSTADLLRRAAEVGDQHGSQAAFARLVGWDKSHVTRLKQLGQLVMAADGSVAFGASLRRIAEHADPGRDAQRDAAAQRRPADLAVPPASAGDDAEPEGTGPKYADSRATKEYWAAKSAELEYQKASGELVRRDAVDKAVADAAMQFRQAVDNQPHRLADRLVGLDLDQIRARLREDGEQMLGELSRGFAKRLQQLGQPGAEGGAA